MANSCILGDIFRDMGEEGGQGKSPPPPPRGIVTFLDLSITDKIFIKMILTHKNQVPTFWGYHSSNHNNEMLMFRSG